MKNVEHCLENDICAFFRYEAKKVEYCLLISFLIVFTVNCLRDRQIGDNLYWLLPIL